MSQPRFSMRAESPTGSASLVISVTPSDVDDLARGLTRAVFVGGAGDVCVVDAEGNQAIISSASHQYHPIKIRKILASGTTAAGILALY